MIDPKLNLDEIEAREKAATEGPWDTEDSYSREDYGDERAYQRIGPLKSCDGCAISNKADGDFVAQARTDVPALIAEVRRLQALVEAMEEAISDGASNLNGCDLHAFWRDFHERMAKHAPTTEQSSEHAQYPREYLVLLGLLPPTA